MKNIKNTIKKILATGATIVTMTSCATFDAETEQAEEAKIILSKDIDANPNWSNADRVCFNEALKKVHDKEAEKYSSNPNEKKEALNCFSACGGAFIKKGNECKYMPSKYEVKNNLCLCNGQDIIPYKEKEHADQKLAACQKICESANTDKNKYTADFDKTSQFNECVCKKIVEENQRYY